ncbi:hypothetical protein [Streptomyces sannanensis]|uniref:hypothetical protein n=1 Tax=Streptomyces sannanensis TaxID=285536 RepID=UPI0031ED6A66
MTELELVRVAGGREESALLERYLHDAFGWTPTPSCAPARSRTSWSPQGNTTVQERWT